jgi:hypothetical protein
MAGQVQLHRPGRVGSLRSIHGALPDWSTQLIAEPTAAPNFASQPDPLAKLAHTKGHHLARPGLHAGALQDRRTLLARRSGTTV